MARRRHPMNVRFARIHEQLGAFLESPAVLMRWLASHEEVPWIESALVSGMREVRVVTMTSSFEHPQAHGFVLGQELLRKFESDAGKAWRVPALPSGTPDSTAIAVMAESFARQVCAPAGERLVLELDPTSVCDVRSYVVWLERALAAATSCSFRLMVIEDAKERPLERLALRVGQVMSVRADLSIDRAVEELAEQQSMSLEGQIRLAIVRCMHLCRRGEIEAASAVARGALPLVEQSGLPELGVPIQFALGATWMARSDFLSAVRAYRDAELAAERAVANARPQSAELRVFARLGIGSALIAADATLQAAEHFEETAKLAAALPSVRLEIESRRLAAYCFERDRAPQKAWDTAFAGLAILVRTPIEARPQHAAVELGRTLLRLTDLREFRSCRDGITAQLDKHLGHGWNSTLEQPT